MNSRTRVLTIIVQLVISVAILYLLLQGIDFETTAEIILNVNPVFILISCSFFVFASAVVGLTLHRALQATEVQAPKRTVISASFGGQLLSDITPARSGYFATPVLLNKMGDVPLEKGLMSVMATGAINFFVKAVFSAIAFAYFLNRFVIEAAIANSLLVGISLLLIGGVGLTLLVWTDYLPKITMRLYNVPLLGKLLKKLDSLISIFKTNKNSLKNSVTSIAILFLVSILLNAFALFLIAYSVGVNTLPFQDFMFMVPIAAAFMYIPVTFAGLGIQEAGYIFILTSLGVPFENALTFALLVRIMFTGTDILGLPSLLKTGTGLMNLITREKAPEAKDAAS